jgi:hypothetical protein
LYAGLPSEILSVPGTSLQIQHVAMIKEKNIGLIKIGNFRDYQ